MIHFLKITSKIPHNISNILRHCPLTKVFSYNTTLTRLYYSIFELPKPLFRSVVANRDSLKQRSLRQLEYDLLCLSATNPENSEKVNCQLYRCYLLTENSALKIIKKSTKKAGWLPFGPPLN